MPDNAKFKSKIVWVGLRYAISVSVFFMVGVIFLLVFRGFWLPDGVEGLRLFVGAVMGAVAIFAPLGWNGQTWGGSTPPEQLDKYLSRVFSVISFFLVIASI